VCYDKKVVDQILNELCSYVETLEGSLGELGLDEENLCEALFLKGNGQAVLKAISAPLHALVSKAFPEAAPLEIGNTGTRFNFEEYFEKRSQVWNRRKSSGSPPKAAQLLYPPIFSPRGLCSVDRGVVGKDNVGPSVEDALRSLQLAKVELSRFTVNFGAADGECGADDDWNADPANCLAEAGWAAVLVEGDQKFFPLLRKRFGDRDDVALMLGFMPLANVTNLLRERLESMPSASSSPDLLKVDVDHADCLFMQEALKVIHPKLIHVEYMPQAPPPLDYVQHYQPGLLEVDLFGRALPLLLAEKLDRHRPGERIMGEDELMKFHRSNMGNIAPATEAPVNAGLQHSEGSKGREFTGCSLAAFLSRS